MSAWVGIPVSPQKMKPFLDIPVSGLREPRPHITVLYLGHATLSQLDTVEQVLQEVASVSPPKVRASGLDIFGPDSLGQALVVTLDSPDLRLMHEVLLTALRDKNYDVPQSYPTYQPHLTLGYIQGAEPTGIKLKREQAWKAKHMESVFWYPSELQLCLSVSIKSSKQNRVIWRKHWTR